MSIKQDLWNKVLEFTSKKQPAFNGIYQAASYCSGLSCQGSCSAHCNHSCEGRCDNTCSSACEDSNTSGSKSTDW